MISRFVERELLDELPPNDPRAIHSRRDLRLINSWMGNSRHLVRAIRALSSRPGTIVELGAGDGTLMLKIARHLPGPVELWLLDAQPVISPQTLDSFGALGWKVHIIEARLEDWIRAPGPLRFDLIVANLFLHHFSNAALGELFARLAKGTNAFISCDPRRGRLSLGFTHLLWCLGCNKVTRHDARISVRAGFREREISALWPADATFVLDEGAAGFASHFFQAKRL